MSISLENPIIVLHSSDTVGVAKKLINHGDQIKIDDHLFHAKTNIQPGHKIALQAIKKGEPIHKYGQIIGFASQLIEQGEHVHTHNVEMREFGRSYEFGADVKPVRHHGHTHQRLFEGFSRAHGKVGTRNYLAVISTVNCSASVARFVADHFKKPEFKRHFPHVDGVIAFNHKSGCGIQPGEPLEMLQRVLAGIAKHPNICGYVMIGLGCEVNPLCSMIERHQLNDDGSHELPPAFIDIQKQGGVQKTVDEAVNAIKGMLPFADAMRRSPQPLSKLILAENCGGSDGNSGITANPALGIAADELIKHHGAAVLAETPEICGAEHLLARRAISAEIGEKLISRVAWWKRHVALFDATIDNNPSLGNKAGGITTIYEKSLGAIAKGGHTPLNAVYQYAEPITCKGLSFMDTPGFDPVSMTGLVAGGCNIGVFTTGRGSVYGCKPTPCIKVATNTLLYEQMMADMDINAGTILDGIETVAEAGLRIFEKIVAVASGEKTKSELLGIGDEEFAPWLLGPTF